MFKISYLLALLCIAVAARKHRSSEITSSQSGHRSSEITSSQSDSSEENPCDKKECPMNSACLLDQDGLANCVCITGFTGEYCNKPVCIPNPCVNGHCLFDVNTQTETCCCDEGYAGDTCSECTKVLPCSEDFPLATTYGKCILAGLASGGVTWLQAQMICNEKGGKLWEPDNQAEMDEVLALPRAFRSGHIGLNDIDEEGTFVYASTGIPYDPLLFDNNRVGSNDEYGDCVVVFPLGSRAVGCDLLYTGYFCETQRPTSCTTQPPTE